MNTIPHPTQSGMDLSLVGQQPPEVRVVNACGIDVVPETYERKDAICSLRFLDIPGNKVHMITLPLKTAQALRDQLDNAVGKLTLLRDTDGKHVS